MLNPDQVKQSSSFYDGPESSGFESKAIDLASLGDILWRRKIIIAAIVFLCLGLAVLFVQTSKPLYSAQTRILIDPRNSTELSGGGGSPTLIQIGMDPSSINSQVELLESRELATTVLRNLNLDKDPEFLTPSNVVEGALNAIRHAIAPASSNIDLKDGIDPEIVDTFLSRLSVERLKETYVLSVTVMSRSPERAALIANELGRSYIAKLLSAKQQMAGVASDWLTQQLGQRRNESIDAERKVQQFRAANDIIGAGADSIVNEEIVRETAQQLVTAESTTSQIRSKSIALAAAVVSPKPDAAIVDFLDDPEVLGLRQKYSQTVLQSAQAESIYGQGNVKIAEALKKSLREQMSDALSRLKQTYEKRLGVAVANEAALRAKMEELIDKMKLRDAARVELNVLQRNTDSAAALYSSMLERYKTVAQDQSFPVTDARVVDPATIPNAKSSPRMLVSLALGGVGGLALGLAAALMIELRNRAIRLPRDIEKVVGPVRIAFMPKVPVVLPSGRWRGEHADGRNVLPNDIGIYRYSVEHPFSLFTEALRSVRIGMDTLAGASALVTIGVVSSLPREGKSLSAVNLAQLMTHGGKRVLLIDADLRQRGLTTGLVDCDAPGLLQVLRDGADYAALTLTDPVTNLQILAAGSDRRVPNTSDLLGSDAMRALLRNVSDDFDYVVLDLPPMAPLVDVRAVSNALDGFLLVAKWGSTSSLTVAEALKNNPLVREKLLGVILTSVDVKQLRRYMPNGDGYMSERGLKSYFS